MAQLPADRTKLALAQANQTPGLVADASANKNALTEAYDTIDLLWQYANQILQGIYDAGKFTKLAIVNVKDAPFNAKGDGVTDDTAAIQSAINFCAANKFTLDLSNGIYYITNTLTIYKSSTGRHEFRIMCNKAQIVTDKAITMVQVVTQTGNTYAQGWSVCLDNLNLMGNRAATVGLYIDNAQGVHINSLYVDQCLTGLKVRDIYYAAFDGLSIINNCNTGIAITGAENNAVNFRNFWIIGGSRYDTVNSIGVDIQTRGLDLTFSNLTIEVYATAIKQTAGSGQLIMDIRDCYFEQINQSYISITGAGSIADVLCTINNCHGNETRSALAQSALRVGKGFYEIKNNNFKDNVVEYTALNTNSETDMPVFIFEAGSANGYQQYARNVPRQRSGFNSIAAMTKQNQQLIRNETYNTFGKVFPANTYMNRDIAFDKYLGVVLTAPNGNLYRLVVDNTGTLTTQAVNNQGRSFVLPPYNSFSIGDILATDLGRYKYAQIICEDTNMTYNVTGGTTSYIGGSALGLKVSGNIAYIIGALTSVITSQTFNSLFIYNTDINRFYVLQGDYWAWAGTMPWREFGTTRAVGTTAQRPGGVASGFIYYDTTISAYVTWNGAAWV